MNRAAPDDPQRQLRALLEEQQLAVLATSEAGRPYTSLVAFAVTPDLDAILFATERATRKHANLTTEPRVALLVDNRAHRERDLYEARLRFRPKRAIWVLREFEVKGQRMNYFFTGDKPIWEDPLHTGRKDEVNAVEFYVTTKKIYGPISLKYGYRYAQRVSSLPGTFEGDDAEDKDYKNNRTWLEVRYAL